jgi:prophage regulatory protein
MSQAIQNKHSVLRLSQVIFKSGLSRSSIYQQIGEGTFPKQFNLGPRAVGWLESDIQEWINVRIQQRDEVSSV